MATDEAMLQEAITAAREGNKARARDLLSRLLRIDRDNPDHWLWMSAVVETRQEQIYCLQNLLRVDPDNLIARRGLIMMGELTVKPGEVQPAALKRDQPWSVADLELERPRGFRVMMTNPGIRAFVYLAGIGLFLWIAYLALNGFQGLLNSGPPDFAATARAVGEVITLTPSLTPVPTETPLFRTATPTPENPTPLALLLEATYTPTPRYINTPHNTTQAFRLGMQALDEEDWEQVIEYMSQTLDLEPDAVDAIFYTGEAYLQLGRYELAMETFDEAILASREFGPAHLGRAIARLGIDPDADVDQDFRNAIVFSPDYVRIYLERARYYIRLGEYEEALSDLDVAGRLSPESPEVPYLRALAAFTQRNMEDALFFAEEAHERDFTHLPTYLLLGRIHAETDNFVAALEWLETYRLYRPEDTGAAFTLALVHIADGTPERALQIFERLRAEGEESADILLGLGLAYIELGEGQLALDELNQANRIDRNNFEIQLALGRALMVEGQPGGAYVQYNDTEPLAGSDEQRAQLYYYRGLALKAIFEKGDSTSLQAAMRDLARAIELGQYLRPSQVDHAGEMLQALDEAAPAP